MWHTNRTEFRSPTCFIAIQENSQCLYFEITPMKLFISFPILSNKLQSFDDPYQFLTERENHLMQTINEISDISESTE
jgi:hypothetical protein